MYHLLYLDYICTRLNKPSNFRTMINITLPDGSVKSFEKGSTAMDVALSISEGLARNVLAASVNGVVCDATMPIEADATLVLHTSRDQEGMPLFGTPQRTSWLRP